MLYMNTKMVLKEYAIDGAVEVPEIVSDLLKDNNFTSHPFVKTYFKNYAKETALTTEKGAARGQSVSDANGATSGYQVAATLQILNSVIRGYNRYMSDVFVKKYTTDSTTFKIPLTEYIETADDIDAADASVAVANKTIDYVTVDLSTPESERGAKVTWTRNALEDTTFDLQGEMLEGLGFAIAVKQMKVIIAALAAVDGEDMPSGSVVDLSDAITWEEFLSVVGAVDTGVLQEDTTYKTYGPADYCLVSPDIYWQLLNIIQLTNVLYEGSTDPVKNGVIKLALGTTIVKMSLLPKGTMYALNSEKAIAMVVRRALKLEPIIFPEQNRYGFLGTVRFQPAVIFKAAIQKGSTSGS